MPSIFSVLGIAYLIVLFLGACTYFLGGLEAVQSPASLGIGGLVIVIASAYWMISYLDARLEVKKRDKR